MATPRFVTLSDGREARMRVAVICGGRSAEREVSVASATNVLKALRGQGHEAIAVDLERGRLGRADEARLLSAEIGSVPPVDKGGIENVKLPARFAWLTDAGCGGSSDVLFLAVHGGAGEDGTLQAVLETAGFPFTGSGFRGCALAFDKDTAKRLFLSAGVPTPRWLMAPCSPEEVGARLGWPVVVKPNKQGSTVGLSLAKGPADLKPAIAAALRYDDEAMVEAFVPGRELTVGVLEDRALAVGEIVCPDGGIFDYATKYRPGAAQEIFPAPLSQAETETVRNLALRAHRACRLRDYSRVDFRLDGAGRWWCLEVNSLPGLTPTSLFPQSAAATGIGFPELCERICRLAMKRHGNQAARLGRLRY